MRPTNFSTIALSQPPPRFDDGDPHLRSTSPPGQRRGGLWMLSQRGAPAVRVKIKIDKA